MKSRREHLSGVFDFLKRKRAGAPPREAPVPVNVDLYQVLGVSGNASPDEIRAIYRDLARRYHPDRNPGDAEAYQKFLDISKAYDILSDETLRAAYDQARGRGLGPVRPEEKRRPPQERGISTFILSPEEAERERRRRRPLRDPSKMPWDILFEEPEERVQPLYAAFSPSVARPATPPPWDVLFPERMRVTFPTREQLLEGVQKLPLAGIWEFIRENRMTPRFFESRTMVLGPVAGSGSDPVEHDLALLTGASFDEIAAFAERKGLHRAWRNVLGPLAEQAVFAIESLKPADIPGAFYIDWDPSGKMLELLYTEGAPA